MMVSMLFVFYVFIVMFALIGSMRGWAKEILVIFSVIIALALIAVLEKRIPVVNTFINSNPNLQLGVRVLAVVLVAFFGYQSPKFTRLGKVADRRERVQDILLGVILGMISGYMIVGTIWYFLHMANYGPFVKYVMPGTPDLMATTDRVIKYLPPTWIGSEPNIYVAVVLIAIIIIAVFV